jgi:hypothetical protein
MRAGQATGRNDSLLGKKILERQKEKEIFSPNAGKSGYIKK